MARSDFALGVMLGGLAGVAAGYFMSRSGQDILEQPPVGAIDLTPAMERRDAEAASDPAPVISPARRRKTAEAAE